MKRQLCQLGLLAAVTIAVPTAIAQGKIVKCVDGAGRVTLTDMPCEAGSATVRVASMASNQGITRVDPYPMRVERAVMPPSEVLQRRAEGLQREPARPLASDVATLKAARAQFLIGDAGSRETLATLD